MGKQYLESHAMLKSDYFSVIQILREIDFHENLNFSYREGDPTNRKPGSHLNLQWLPTF